MGAIYSNAGTASNVKVPANRFPAALIFRAVYLREIKHEEASNAMYDLLKQVPQVLADHGYSITDYERPGQTMSGCKKQFDYMVETNLYWYNEATAAGFQLNNVPPDPAFSFAPNPPVDIQALLARPVDKFPGKPSGYGYSKKAKTAKAQIPVAPPAPLTMPTTPGLEVPQLAETPECNRRGQLRRAILRALGFFKDGGKTTFSQADLMVSLVGDKFMKPDPKWCHDSRYLLTELLDEMGVYGTKIPWKFPVLVNGEVVAKATIDQPHNAFPLVEPTPAPMVVVPVPPAPASPSEGQTTATTTPPATPAPAEPPTGGVETDAELAALMTQLENEDSQTETVPPSKPAKPELWG